MNKTKIILLIFVLLFDSKKPLSFEDKKFLEYAPKSSIVKNIKLPYGYKKKLGFNNQNEKIFEILYYPNNHIKEKKYFYKGKLHGKYIGFDRKGNREFENSYKNGKRHGKWESGPKNFLYSVVEYKNGKLDGKYIVWTRDKKRQIYIYGEFKDGLGYMKYYYPSGKPSLIMKWFKENDNIIQADIFYDEDGKIKEQRKLINGCGKFFTKKNGKVVKFEEFVNYKRNGRWFLRGDNGDTIFSVGYLNGLFHGAWQIKSSSKDEIITSLKGNFDKGTGKLEGIYKNQKYVKVFENGNVIKFDMWYENGKKKFERLYDKEGNIKKYGDWDSAGNDEEKLKTKFNNFPLLYPIHFFGRLIF